VRWIGDARKVVDRRSSNDDNDEGGDTRGDINRRNKFRALREDDVSARHSMPGED